MDGGAQALLHGGIDLFTCGWSIRCWPETRALLGLARYKRSYMPQRVLIPASGAACCCTEEVQPTSVVPATPPAVGWLWGGVLGVHMYVHAIGIDILLWCKHHAQPPSCVYILFGGRPVLYVVLDIPARLSVHQPPSAKHAVTAAARAAVPPAPPRRPPPSICLRPTPSLYYRAMTTRM